MQKLVQLYPALESMAVARHGNILSFATPTGRCHFLEPDNLCRIEKEHGKQQKPGVCMLFPFNVFTRIGKTIAISPHFIARCG
jgi:Fe-S-cluster containining protein